MAEKPRPQEDSEHFDVRGNPIPDDQWKKMPQWLKDNIEATKRKDKVEIKNAREGLAEVMENELLDKVVKESAVIIGTQFNEWWRGKNRTGSEPGYKTAALGFKQNIGVTRPHGPEEGFRNGAEIQLSKINCTGDTEDEEKEQLKGILNESINKDTKIGEFIDVRKVKSKIFEEKIVEPGRQGFLGIGRKPEKKIQKWTGKYKPVLHSEIAEGGKDEPAVRFHYYFGHNENYVDSTKVREKGLDVEFYLPESTARDLEVLIDQDPTKIRKFIEKMVTERLLKDQSDWTQEFGGSALRPPWEKWDKEQGGNPKIYIQKEGGEPGFHPENFHTKKKN